MISLTIDENVQLLCVNVIFPEKIENFVIKTRCNNVNVSYC